MPIAQINMIEGRTEEQKEALIAEVAAAICRALDAPEESVRVIIQEIPNHSWGIGGKTAKSLGR